MFGLLDTHLIQLRSLIIKFHRDMNVEDNFFHRKNFLTILWMASASSARKASSLPAYDTINSFSGWRVYDMRINRKITETTFRYSVFCILNYIHWAH